MISGLSGLFIAPNTVDASVFSFFSNVTSAKEAPDSFSAGVNGSKYNSQNLALLEAPLTYRPLTGGGEISIVDSSALEYQAESGAPVFQNDQISAYVVHDGDTLSQIAEMFGVSVNTIVWANDIERGLIKPGQTLVILPVSGIRHIVKSGETIQSIAKMHNGDLQEILQFNDLAAGAKLAVGDEIIIPDGDAGSVPSKSSSGSGVKSIPGYFKSPIVGNYRKTQGLHGHNGVDLAAPSNTQIVAAAAGTVIVSKNFGYNGGYGNYIVISHPNGTQTLYGHLNSTVVSSGASVSQGQLIGYMGSTGRSTGTHLHFEVRGAKNPF